MSLKAVCEAFPEITFSRECEGPGGYRNVFITFTGTVPLSERSLLIMQLENRLIIDIDPNIRVWNEPIGDKNSLRNLRGVQAK